MLLNAIKAIGLSIGLVSPALVGLVAITSVQFGGAVILMSIGLSILGNFILHELEVR